MLNYWQLTSLLHQDNRLHVLIGVNAFEFTINKQNATSTTRRAHVNNDQDTMAPSSMPQNNNNATIKQQKWRQVQRIGKQTKVRSALHEKAVCKATQHEATWHNTTRQCTHVPGSSWSSPLWHTNNQQVDRQMNAMWDSCAHSNHRMTQDMCMPTMIGWARSVAQCGHRGILFFVCLNDVCMLECGATLQ